MLCLGFKWGKDLLLKMIIYCAYRLNVLFKLGIWMQPVYNMVKKQRCPYYSALILPPHAVRLCKFFQDKASATFVNVKGNTVLEGYHHLFSSHYLEFLKCLLPKCDSSIQFNPSFNIKEVTFVAVITHKVKLKDFLVKDDL